MNFPMDCATAQLQFTHGHQRLLCSDSVSSSCVLLPDLALGAGRWAHRVLVSVPCVPCAPSAPRIGLTQGTLAEGYIPAVLWIHCPHFQQTSKKESVWSQLGHVSPCHLRTTGFGLQR